jgi:hypothetical protein
MCFLCFSILLLSPNYAFLSLPFFFVSSVIPKFFHCFWLPSFYVSAVVSPQLCSASYLRYAVTLPLLIYPRLLKAFGYSENLAFSMPVVI